MISALQQPLSSDGSSHRSRCRSRRRRYDYYTSSSPMIFRISTMIIMFCSFLLYPKVTTAKSLELSLYKLNSTVYPKAVCLDGSTPGYYYTPGWNEGSHKWYIEMQGGGWCFSLENCRQRSKTNRGSSVDWSSTFRRDGSPFFQSDSDKNPLTHNWNRIYIPYCDGYSFSGNVTNPMPLVEEADGTTITTMLYSRGNEIFHAIASDLLIRKGLQLSTDVIISGCSAGGLSTMLRCDDWSRRIHEYQDSFVSSNMLSAPTKVVCAPESGFFLSYDNMKSGLTYSDIMKNGWNLHQPVLPQKCVDANRHNPSNCIFAEYVTPHVETPLFVMQPKYDIWSKGVIQGSNGNLTEINNFGALVTNTLLASTITTEGESHNHSNGIFLDSCARHCNGYHVEINGMTKVEALKVWYEREIGSLASNDIHIQQDEYLCEECCFAPTITAAPTSSSPTRSPFQEFNGIAEFVPLGSSLYGTPASDDLSKVEFGSTVALSSLFNTHHGESQYLVVGAPLHDWTTPYSNDSTSSPQDSGGGIYLYEFDHTNTKTWNMIWFLRGSTAGEKLGHRVSISADGSRLAVRRHNTLTSESYVEVYNIDHDTSTSSSLASIVGGPITSTSKGDTVTLSSDGRRVAVSSESFSASKGIVDIYEFDGNNWASIGSIQGVHAQGRFGWITAFSTNGDRLAISSPSSNGDGLTKRGLVRVFDYDITTTTWAQVGQDIQGTNANEAFGFGLALSGDGTTLIAGSPGSITGNGLKPQGKVSIYRLDDDVNDANGTTKWVLRGNDIYGVVDNDRFGRTVSISNDGSRVVAASFYHNQQRGQARIFDWIGDDNTWVQVGSDIVGEAPQDRLGWGIFSIAMSGDGRHIATGSLWGSNLDGLPTGSVRVFEEKFVTASPSRMPSPVPSNRPSIKPTPVPSFRPSRRPSWFPTNKPSLIPSALPTMEPSWFPTNKPSLMPSALPTMEPSIVPTTNPFPATPTEKNNEGTGDTAPSILFSWDVERMGSATVQFNEESLRKDIVVEYNISLRDTTVVVYEDDCKTVVSDDVVTIKKDVAQTSDTHGNLTVDLDVKQDNIVGSAIWMDGNTTSTGHIDICVRVDLVLPVDENASASAIAESVNFSETKIAISVDMTQSFLLSIDLDRVVPDTLAHDTEIKYDILACQCNNITQDCVNDTLVQGSDLFICLQTNDPNVDIAGVQDFRLTQATGGLRWISIEDGVEDTLTNVTLQGTKCQIRAKLVSQFFSEKDPVGVFASGIVTLAFASEIDNYGESRTRFLETDFRSRREEETETEPRGSFDVGIELGVQPLDGASVDPVRLAGILFFVIVCALTLFRWYIKCVFAVFKRRRFSCLGCN